MPITLVHPGNERAVQAAAPPARLASLKGKKIALLDISKPGGSLFLDRLEEILRTRFGVAEIVRTRKPAFSKIAPPQVMEQLLGKDAVIEALAD
jgi:hypothetical protein